MKKTTFAIFCSFFFSLTSYADNYIAVGAARIRKTQVAMPNFAASPSASSTEKLIQQKIVQNLNFMGFFTFLESSKFSSFAQPSLIAPGSFPLDPWKKIQTDVLLKGSVQVEGDQLVFEAHAFYVHLSKEVLAKRYIAKKSEAELIAHNFSNDLIQALTGKPGIFLTQIAMACDQSKRSKEIFFMNYDGSDVRKITSHRSTAFSPAWSPDGSKLAYSVIAKQRSNIKNINLYEYNLKTKNLRLLSNKKGINSGAFYHPNGKSLALTMSFLGNPEIFSLDLSSLEATRLTKSFGVDVDPAYSSDGRNLSFVSSRTGAPMVYRMSSDGSNLKRLTYAGKYNATPNWTDDSGKVVFAGWTDNHFDLFIMNSDGTKLERLTKGQGNNEDPFLSPDGNFIVFSSNRTGQYNIYIMNLDGTGTKRLTYGLGNCQSPKWSK